MFLLFHVKYLLVEGKDEQRKTVDAAGKLLDSQQGNVISSAIFDRAYRF